MKVQLHTNLVNRGLTCNTAQNAGVSKVNFGTTKAKTVEDLIALIQANEPIMPGKKLTRGDLLIDIFKPNYPIWATQNWVYYAMQKKYDQTMVYNFLKDMERAEILEIRTEWAVLNDRGAILVKSLQKASEAVARKAARTAAQAAR